MFGHDERDQQCDPDRQARDHSYRSEARRRCVDQTDHQRSERSGPERGTSPIDAAPRRLSPTFRNPRHADDDDGDAEREIQKEDPPPTEVIREPSADEWTKPRRYGGERRPGADRTSAF